MNHVVVTYTNEEGRSKALRSVCGFFADLLGTCREEPTNVTHGRGAPEYDPTRGASQVYNNITERRKYMHKGGQRRKKSGQDREKKDEKKDFARNNGDKIAQAPATKKSTATQVREYEQPWGVGTRIRRLRAFSPLLSIFVPFSAAIAWLQPFLRRREIRQQPQPGAGWPKVILYFYILS